MEAVSAFRPELVLLDIGLPGIDGHEVAMRLRGMPHGEKLLIVVVTGYGQEEDRRRSHEAGFDAHLLKPVALEVLKKLLNHPKLTPQAV
jgi:CheY-like chemotaxis protein